MLGGDSVAQTLDAADEEGVGLTEEEMKLEQQLLEVRKLFIQLHV